MAEERQGLCCSSRCRKQMLVAGSIEGQPVRHGCRRCGDLLENGASVVGHHGRGLVPAVVVVRIGRREEHADQGLQLLDLVPQHGDVVGEHVGGVGDNMGDDGGSTGTGGERKHGVFRIGRPLEELEVLWVVREVWIHG